MKFLEWINNKPFKDFGFRNSCLCLSSRATIDGKEFELGKKRRYNYESNTFKQDFEEETFPTSDYFDGFLTIGTLGSDNTITGPGTPTFSIAFDQTSQRQTDVTDEDLKLANYKLEKFLETEYKEDWFDDESKEKAMMCPLQEYLLGSSIEMKKEDAAIEGEIQSQQSNKATGKLMKKMMKKIDINFFNLQRSESEKAAESKPTKKKLDKVLRMFQRKVHPESCLSEKGCLNSDKGNSRNENGKKFGEFSDQILGFKSKTILPEDGMNSRNSAEKRGRWIKTDADYLVLELKTEGI